jgi:hypothetical protein
MLLVDTVDAGGLSQAARRLNMSRANVSYRLGKWKASSNCNSCDKDDRGGAVQSADGRIRNELVDHMAHPGAEMLLPRPYSVDFDACRHKPAKDGRQCAVRNVVSNERDGQLHKSQTSNRSSHPGLTVAEPVGRRRGKSSVHPSVLDQPDQGWTFEGTHDARWAPNVGRCRGFPMK